MPMCTITRNHTVNGVDLQPGTMIFLPPAAIAAAVAEGWIAEPVPEPTSEEVRTDSTEPEPRSGSIEPAKGKSKP